jgi:hypothetical protein
MSQVPCKLTRSVEVNGLCERMMCLIDEPPRPYLSRKIIPLLSHDQRVIVLEKVRRLPCISRMVA